jgi:hypothetical protein
MTQFMKWLKRLVGPLALVGAWVLNTSWFETRDDRLLFFHSSIGWAIVASCIAGLYYENREKRL